MAEPTGFVNPFGFRVNKVGVGTEITDPDTGAKFTVTESSVVMSRDQLWVTSKQYEAIKDRIDPPA